MNFKRIILFSALFAVCSVAINAQLLWKVSGNGLEKPSFLFGTHHIAPTSMLDSIAGFNDAIKNCDAVYGEVEKTELTSQDTQMKMMQKITAPTDSTLSKLLDAETFAVLDSILKTSSAGMVGAKQLDNFKPSFASSQLSLLFTMQQFPGFNPAEQIDIAIQNKASQLGKTLNGFENVDFQLDVLYGKPISEQARSLTDLLHHIDKSKKSISHLASAYTSQDITKIEKVFFDDFYDSDSTPEEIESNLKRLIYDRNDAWINKLREIMPTQSIFVVVGAGHLVGDKGLIAQLRGLGYTVTPMQ